ncbi:hypothetical protein [Cryobacterium zhongshanensis]|uniref:Uncharacterized protein n=1 Tax=Cryobacterium zhongshanensis TaxID=2928153 RepID=A0AA41UJD1_9MICO|nr:hypothetical protein [Cryobacterium zhongshanensis]MCI4656841.1 hypothetical protein [Cryobacterium zhongshanensis]
MTARRNIVIAGASAVCGFLGVIASMIWLVVLGYRADAGEQIPVGLAWTPLGVSLLTVLLSAGWLLRAALTSQRDQGDGAS